MKVRSAAWWSIAILGCGTPPQDDKDPVDTDDPMEETDAVETDVVRDSDVVVSRTTLPEPMIVDVAHVAGVQSALGDLRRGRACVAADFDVDGSVDLFVGNPGDLSYFLRNTTDEAGSATFAPAELLVGDAEVTWSGSAVDYDGDDDVDLFVGMGGNEGRGLDRMYTNTSTPGTLSFADAATTLNLQGRQFDGVARPLATANGTWMDFDRDADLDLFVNVNTNEAVDGLEPWENARNRLMVQGPAGFTDVATEAGLTSERRTRHSTWIDVDNDGDFDLYESNYLGRNVFWRNMLVETGRADFVDITDYLASVGADVGDANRTFAAAAGDVNNDGREDLIVFTRSPRNGDCSSPDLVEDGTPEALEGHHVFLNMGRAEGFVDVADMSGINAYSYYRSDVGWGALGVMGCQVADLNADGMLDIFVGNGGPLRGERNHLFAAKEIREVEIDGLTVKVPFYADWSAMIDMPAAAADPSLEYPTYPYRTHGTCIADFDDDGLPEMYVTNGGMAAFDDFVREPDRLFDVRYPEGEAPDTLWVRVRGDALNVPRDAVGTKVAVTYTDTTGKAHTIYRVYYAGSAFSAQNGNEIFFGLGYADRIDEVRVRWPDGTYQDVPPPALGSRIVVDYAPQ